MKNNNINQEAHQKKSALVFIICIILVAFLGYFVKVQLNDHSKKFFFVEDYRESLDKDDGVSILRAMSAADKNGSGEVILENKEYEISFSELEIPSNVTLKGKGNKSKIKTNIDGSIFKVSGEKNIGIIGIEFQGPNNKTNVLEVDTTNGVYIKDCKAINVRLFKSILPTNIKYSNMSKNYLNKNISIINNLATGYDKSLPESCISLGFVKNVTVKGNRISNYYHGISWWGGDSNTNVNGDLTNPRWAIDIFISRNKVSNIHMGGIWGSMGYNVIVSNGNIVKNCGDVGIDFEGSISSKAVGNYVENCTNGAITTFFRNKDILISKNTVKANTNGQYLFKIYNSSKHQNESIKVFNNNFIFSGKGIGYVGGEQIDSMYFSENKLVNVAINFYSINYKKITISNNELMFSNDAQKITAIYISSLIKNGTVDIRNNNIESKYQLNNGNRGIYVELNDHNSSTTANIEKNRIVGFVIDIECFSNSKNQGINSNFNVKDNLMASRNLLFRKNSTNKGTLSLSGNYDENKILYNPTITK